MLTSADLLPPPYWKARRPWGRGCMVNESTAVWTSPQVAEARNMSIGIVAHVDTIGKQREQETVSHPECE